jgi:hypothetical protein
LARSWLRAAGGGGVRGEVGGGVRGEVGGGVRGEVGGGVRGEVGGGGEAAGADAGGAVQGVDAETGVVGKSGHAGEAEEEIGLGVGIGEECVVDLDIRFGRVFGDAGVVEGQDAADGVAENGADLPCLVGTAGGEEEGALSGRWHRAAIRAGAGCRRGRGAACPAARRG